MTSKIYNKVIYDTYRDKVEFYADNSTDYVAISVWEDNKMAVAVFDTKGDIIRLRDELNKMLAVIDDKVIT